MDVLDDGCQTGSVFDSDYTAPGPNTIPTKLVKKNSNKTAEEVLWDTTTPQILHGHDGIKYSSDPTSEFRGLFVSVDREVVDVDNAEFKRQLVLVRTEERPQKPEGPELKRGEEVFRMAKGGVFDGYFVGIVRKITRLKGEEYVQFVVLVPFSMGECGSSLT